LRTFPPLSVHGVKTPPTTFFTCSRVVSMPHPIFFWGVDSTPPLTFFLLKGSSLLSFLGLLKNPNKKPFGFFFFFFFSTRVWTGTFHFPCGGGFNFFHCPPSGAAFSVAPQTLADGKKFPQRGAVVRAVDHPPPSIGRGTQPNHF